MSRKSWLPDVRCATNDLANKRCVSREIFSGGKQIKENI